MKRHQKWTDVPDEDWTSWKWQLKNRMNTYEDLSEVLNLTTSEIQVMSQDAIFRIGITPYFLSLIDQDNPDCPVRKQVMPSMHELGAFEGMEEDSLAEDQYSPVNGIVHRYPDRVLMLITTQCSSYCRYCTRSRLVGDDSKNYSSVDISAQIEYIKSNKQIRDVLISGGDPLVMPTKRLDAILTQLREIPHLEIIRLGTRTPVFNPFVITQELCDTLEKHHPIWVNIHVNHPNEITPELADACNRLSKAGIPLGNQAVLLKGINDSVAIQRKLCTELVKIRVRPYYLYQCDMVKGAGHFITPVSKGMEIMEGLRGHISGYAVPTYVIDAPHGGGKVPIAPNYVLCQGENETVVRNFEGFISVYHDSGMSKTPSGEKSNSEGQSIHGLLNGNQKFLKPQNFREEREEVRIGERKNN